MVDAKTPLIQLIEVLVCGMYVFIGQGVLGFSSTRIVAFPLCGYKTVWSEDPLFVFLCCVACHEKTGPPPKPVPRDKKWHAIIGPPRRKLVPTAHYT